ncbi:MULTISPECIES: competence/damage-inducible protein A [Mesonia]|mgnify:FL=1|uniref:competence/damage-inducible protein A n=3 Tax=Flavobacteriaceae TaxID=49546 RepID=UPI0017502220|nr:MULTISPECIES: competence/damage-inducible protein A [Mesonia]HIB36300.1 competence/damage-inducible protein A [Mesonia sp.]
MKAEIITIGDEILIGQIVDSNSAFIGKELNKIGVDVRQITSIQDDEEHILTSLKEASQRAQIIIVTGGLGPTKDDITKKTFCKYFNDELVLNEQVLQNVEELFRKYVKDPISDLNRGQAYIPSKAQALFNQFGTAPGMWIEQDDVVYISLPGVPFEMKALMQNQVLGKLQERFKRPYIIHKTVLTYGMGESTIAEKIEDWEDQLPSFIKLAYLPSLGRVRLRLSARGENEQLLLDELENQLEKLHQLIGDIIKGYEGEGSLEEQIAQKFIEKGLSLTTAESCTGGRIASQLTAVSGASKFFKGGLVTYETATKNYVLGISQEIIDTYSVVSAEITKEMAIKAKALFRTDYAIATTGNAGPTKGDSDAEIGTVFIAIATPSGVEVFENHLGKQREKVTEKAVYKALGLILDEVNK